MKDQQFCAKSRQKNILVCLHILKLKDKYFLILILSFCFDT